MSAAYLATKKLTGAAIVLTAARHNLREIQAELGADGYIDPARSCCNLRLVGPDTAAAVADLASNAMQDAGVAKLRKDAVRAVEVVISLPEGFAVDVPAFFADALAWVRDFYAVPVLSAVVHLDEAAPHLHVLLLPLRDGRMVGSDLVGDRTRLQAMQCGFYDVVARKYGLAKPRAEKRLSRAMRDNAARLALDCLQGHPERLQWPSVRMALVQCIAANPAQIIAALGLEMPTGKTRTKITGKDAVTRLMIKPCKPEPKPIGFRKQRQSAKPIGFEPAPSAPNPEPYHCVGFASGETASQAPILPAHPSQEPEQTTATHPPLVDRVEDDNDEVRELDADKAGWLWDGDLGEWVKPAPAKTKGKARAWAEKEMQRMTSLGLRPAKCLQ